MERITDIHVHVQPWNQLRPDVLESLTRDHKEHYDHLVALMNDPAVLLEHLDRNGIWRVGLINYPSPGVKDLRVNLDQFLALPLSDTFKHKATVETPLAFFPNEPNVSTH